MRNEHVSLRLAAALGLLLALVPATSAVAEESSAPEVHLGRVRATEAERRADLDKANALYGQKEYREAIELVTSVNEKLENDTAKIDVEVLNSLKKAAQKLEYQIREDWAQSVFRQAQIAAGDSRYDDAISLATEAADINVEIKNKSDRLIADCKDKITEAERSNILAVKGFAPEIQKDNKAVEQLLLAAEVLLQNNEPEKALDRIEHVFILDPTNVKATELAGRIYNNLYAYGVARRKADIEGLYAFGEWQWTEPVFPEITGAVNPQERGSVKQADGQQMISKMDRIILPKVDLDDSGISEALEYIARLSEKNDPNKRGVVINTNNLPENSDNYRVSLHLRNIPLSEAIRYVCQQTGLKYQINQDSVSIGKNVNDMVSRRFTAPSNLIGYVMAETADSASAAGSESSSSGGAVVKGGHSSSGETVSNAKSIQKVSEEQWKTYFRKRGIRFDEGSKVAYRERSKQLTVLNTPENLQRLDVLLRQLETVDNPPLIMVEIKSIEVAENDYQELGFDWSIGNGGLSGTDTYFGSNMTMASDGSTSRPDSKSIGWLIGQGVNTVANGIVKTIRGDTSENDGTLSSIVNNWNIFPSLFGSQHPFGSDLPLNISLTINAMDQNKRTETLSAPKVVTSNNMEAKVVLATTYYFPESWDELEVEVDSGSNNGAPVKTVTPPVPSFPEEGTSIGVHFTVTPQVLADNRTIKLHLTPLISVYEGDDIWEIAIKYERYSTTGGWVKDPSLDEIYPISKPIISKREMDVWVDLDNGETVVLGGLVQSKTYTRVDKVPILGDLPLIGRLFQSHAENAKRTNLLFFVTARLLSHDGVPIERDNIPGVPDFNR